MRLEHRVARGGGGGYRLPVPLTTTMVPAGYRTSKCNCNCNHQLHAGKRSRSNVRTMCSQRELEIG